MKDQGYRLLSIDSHARRDVVYCASAWIYDPGSHYAFSNYGYLLLGLVIEELTDTAYAEYVQNTLLEPLGFRQMRLGHSTLEERDPHEVTYHSQYTQKTVLDESGDRVSAPYGWFNLENMAATDGWIASAVDLARFATVFDPSRASILDKGSLETLFALPENMDQETYTEGNDYYAMGWFVRDYGKGRRDTWHSGWLPGTYALLVRRHDGRHWVVLFSQSGDASGLNYLDIDRSLHEASDTADRWPTHDLFDQYLTTKPAHPGSRRR